MIPRTDLIHTYFTPVPDLNLVDETKLLLLWRENWKAQGFETTVLNEYIARQHPYFAEFDQVVSQFPTVNPKKYEVACFHRWLAMAATGGIMADHDCFNRCVPPAKPESIDWDKITVCERGLNGVLVPSLVIASAEGYLWVCERFAEFTAEAAENEGDRAHLSDMLLLNRIYGAHPDRFKVVPLVAMYGDPAWEAKHFTHFSNGSTHRAGKVPRWSHIPTILHEQEASKAKA